MLMLYVRSLLMILRITYKMPKKHGRIIYRFFFIFSLLYGILLL